jgi:hypothetical protein
MMIKLLLFDPAKVGKKTIPQANFYCDFIAEFCDFSQNIRR